MKNDDNQRYQDLSAKLIKENTFLDRDGYPKTVSDMHELIIKTVSNYTNSNKDGSNKRQGVMLCCGSSSDTTANKINPYYLIG